jgi:hypothetical protein
LPPQDRTGLQIDEDPAFQARSWRVQRVGWGVFVVLIIGGLCGLFGSGPLSRATAGSAGDGFEVEYDRFARAHAAATFVIHVNRRLARNDELGILLAGDVIDAIELESSTPPADGTRVTPDGAVLRFKTDRQAGTLTIVLYAKPRRPGALTSRIRVEGGPAHDIRQFVYP